MNPTDQATQWLVALIDRLDLLAAAIALFVIVRAIQPLFSGLRKFWEYYAANSGKAWIDKQRYWLNDVKSKFALTTWWRNATGNITSTLDRVYGFVDPKLPPTPLTATRSFMDQILGSWRNFLQRQAFTRALFIAYIYFYGFCLLLVSDDLSESTNWQLLILLIVNLLFFIGAIKLQSVSRNITIVGVGSLAGIFAAILVGLMVKVIATTGYDVSIIASVGTFIIAGIGASALTFAFAASGVGAGVHTLFITIAGATATAIIGGVILTQISQEVTIIDFSIVNFSLNELLTFLWFAIIILFALDWIRLTRKINIPIEFTRMILVCVFVVFILALLYYLHKLLVFSPPNSLSASPLKLLVTRRGDLFSNSVFYLSASVLIFFVFPWINAALDWLSVSASRAAFYLLHRDLSAEQREDRAYGKAFLHLALDLALALAFKLTVLLLLYIYAQLYGEFGVSFSVDTVKTYWALLNPLDSVAFSWQGLWSSNDHKFITLMVSTTLLPTLLHFGWVLLYVLCRSLWTLLRLLFAFAVSEAATFAATISVLITVAALTALTMAIDPSDDDKDKEGNKTNATQTSELLIPLPHL